jgi:hypothetical protein
MTVLSTRLDEQSTGALDALIKRVVAQLAKNDVKGALNAFARGATILRIEAEAAIGSMSALIRTKKLAWIGVDWLPSRDLAALSAVLNEALFEGRIGEEERVGLVHLAPSGSKGAVSLGLVLSRSGENAWKLRRIFDPLPFVLWTRGRPLEPAKPRVAG